MGEDPYFSRKISYYKNSKENLKSYQEILELSESELINEIPESRNFRLKDGEKIKYVLLVPDRPSRDIVFCLDHARTWTGNPSAFVIAESTRRLIDPSARMLVLPNNNFGESSYSFTRAERKLVAKGDLEPLSLKDVELIKHIGIKKPLIIGYSFGAMRGASLASKLDKKTGLGGAVLLGAPNIIPKKVRGHILLRSKFASQKKFIKPTINNLNIHALAKFEHTDVGVTNWLKFEYGLISYTIGGNFSLTNHSLNNCIMGNQYFNDIEKLLNAHNGVKVILGSSTNDSVSPVEPVSDFIKKTKSNSLTHEVYEGNHTTHLSPRLLGALAKKLL
jgi:pimeloyl-ACP methyl ester carboxylesterase